jgi:hypothetical protein
MAEPDRDPRDVEPGGRPARERVEGSPPGGASPYSRWILILAAIAAVAAIAGFFSIGDRATVTLQGPTGPQTTDVPVTPPAPATPAPSPEPATPAQPPVPVQ